VFEAVVKTLRSYRMNLGLNKSALSKFWSVYLCVMECIFVCYVLLQFKFACWFFRTAVYKWLYIYKNDLKPQVNYVQECLWAMVVSLGC
jgi:hypothetical protein